MNLTGQVQARQPAEGGRPEVAAPEGAHAPPLHRRPPAEDPPRDARRGGGRGSGSGQPQLYGAGQFRARHRSFMSAVSYIAFFYWARCFRARPVPAAGGDARALRERIRVPDGPAGHRRPQGARSGMGEDWQTGRERREWEATDKGGTQGRVEHSQERQRD